MNKMNPFIFLLLVFLSACAGKKQDDSADYYATETREIDGHKVTIAANKYSRGGASNSVTYISYILNVDLRGEVTDVGYLTPMQVSTPKEALELVEIRFSKSGEHMQVKTNVKGGYSTYFHMLKYGPPFRLIFRKAENDPWLNIPLDSFPPTQVMVDSLTINNKQRLLIHKSQSELQIATNSGK